MSSHILMMMVVTAVVVVICTTSAETSSPPIRRRGWPCGDCPVSAIYVDYVLDYGAPDRTVRDAVDSGFNLIILAFYLGSGPADMATQWGRLDNETKLSTMEYVHNASARVIVSWGGGTQVGFDSLNATLMGFTVASWAIQNYLDGVDFDLEGFSVNFTYGGMDKETTIDWCVNITTAAHNVFGPSGIITHAPQAPYFGEPEFYFGGGYNAVYARTSNIIDYLLCQFYNQGPTCYTTYTGLFETSHVDCPYNGGTSVFEIASYEVDGISIPLSKIVVGKPVLRIDAGNGYVPPADLANYLYLAQFDSDTPWPNVGVMAWMWRNTSSTGEWIKAVFNPNDTSLTLSSSSSTILLSSTSSQQAVSSSSSSTSEAATSVTTSSSTLSSTLSSYSLSDTSSTISATTTHGSSSSSSATTTAFSNLGIRIGPSCVTLLLVVIKLCSY